LLKVSSETDNETVGVRPTSRDDFQRAAHLIASVPNAENYKYTPNSAYSKHLPLVSSLNHVLTSATFITHDTTSPCHSFTAGIEIIM